MDIKRKTRFDISFLSSSDLNSLNIFDGLESETETVREEELQKLRQFDLDWRFGPCTGNTQTHLYTVEYQTTVDMIK